MPSERAGIVVGIGEQLFFAPAESVRIVSEQPPITAVPGSGLGMTLIDGRVVPVVAVGSSRGPLLLCDQAGETVALTGLVVLSTGSYPAENDGVVLDGRSIARLDVTGCVLAAAEARQQPDPE